MYEDEKEEVIHDTLNDKERLTFQEKRETDHLLTKHLRYLVQEEIDKRFDEQPTSYNSFKKEEMETLVENILDNFLESDRFESKVIYIVQNVLDGCHVDFSDTAYITY